MTTYHNHLVINLRECLIKHVTLLLLIIRYSKGYVGAHICTACNIMFTISFIKTIISLCHYVCLCVCLSAVCLFTCMFISMPVCLSCLSLICSSRLFNKPNTNLCLYYNNQSAMEVASLCICLWLLYDNKHLANFDKTLMLSQDCRSLVLDLFSSWFYICLTFQK